MWAAALRESPALHDAIALLRTRMARIHPADWVGAYVLLCLSHIFPDGFLGGKLSSARLALLPLPLISAHKTDRFACRAVKSLVGDPRAFPSSQVWVDAKHQEGEKTAADTDEKCSPGNATVELRLDTDPQRTPPNLLLRDVAGLQLVERDRKKLGERDTVLDLLRTFQLKNVLASSAKQFSMILH